MTFFAESGSFTWTTGAPGTTFPVTGLPGQPKVVILKTAGRNTAVDAVGGNVDSIMSYGFAISTTVRFSVAARAADGGTGTATARGNANNAALMEVNTVPAVTGLLDIDSFDANGFTPIVDDSSLAAKRVHWLAIGGTDVSVAAGVEPDPLATGDQPVTGIGIDPAFLLTMTPGAFFSFGAASANAGATMSVGFASAAAAANQFTVGGISRDGVSATNAGSYGRSGECASFIQLSGGNPSVVGRVALASFDVGGFTPNWVESTGGGASEFAWLAIEGGRHHVQTFLSRTSLTTFTEPASPWSPSFTPVGAMFLSHTKPESASDTTDDDNALSVGFADGTNQDAHAYIDVHGPTTTEVTTAVEFDSIYARLVTAALSGTVDLVSFADGQLNLEQTDADPDQAIVGFWAMAGDAVAGLTREQEGFRWREDDGSESAASWLASQDVNVSRAPDEVTRLRMLTDVSGDAPSEGLKLQYRIQGATTWRDVPVE